jgi:hypothetical protein
MTGMYLILAHIFNPFWKLPSFIKWEKAIDINPEDETSFATQYQEPYIKHVEYEYCAKHYHVPVNKLDNL